MHEPHKNAADFSSAAFAQKFSVIRLAAKQEFDVGKGALLP